MAFESLNEFANICYNEFIKSLQIMSNNYVLKVIVTILFTI
ncbi:hypothetical protein CLV59_104608 [Chitinophaga dinghuensis]|uniref:Uncharacterized protein n=1 Tax=Chitinophaga dinghuensis TaxID=1539050 RepID=A0A327W1X3_9BACT|nr:hypothetical protein CLV59_104608 [Chitinophaga dinghuensis]